MASATLPGDRTIVRLGASDEVAHAGRFMISRHVVVTCVTFEKVKRSLNRRITIVRLESLKMD